MMGFARDRIFVRMVCALFAAFFMPSFASAEIEKMVSPSDEGLSFYWWPKLAPIKGWHQDREYSYYYAYNAFAPDGFTFKNADTVMYASAVYKPRCPKLKTLAEFIENDRKNNEANEPGISIQEVAPLTTADGQKLRSFTFFPTKGAIWERVSYGEEDDYYLVFTVSSHSQRGYNETVSDYEKLVTGYKK